MRQTSSPAISLIRMLVVILGALASGCIAHGPEREVSVQTNTFGVEYTPGQVRSLLTDLGYEQVRLETININATNADGNTWTRTTQQFVEMQFRFAPSPAIYLKVIVDKTTGEVLINYSMKEGDSFTTVANEEYVRLKRALGEFAGPDKVREL